MPVEIVPAMQPVAERFRMLLQVARDRVACADPARAPPDHVIMPNALQSLAFGNAEFLRLRIPQQSVDRSERTLTQRRVLLFVHQPFVCHRAGLDKVRPGLRRQRELARLRHEMKQIEEHCRLDDPSILDAIELSEAHHCDLPSWQDAKVRLVKQRHQMPHLNDPAPFETIDLVQSGHEDVGASLHMGHGRQERPPEHIRDGLCSELLIEWMHAAPMPIGRGMAFQDFGHCVG